MFGGGDASKQQAAGTTSLFGGGATNTSTPFSGNTTLFGGGYQQPATTNIFGNQPAQSADATSSNLFGASGSRLFGSGTQPSAAATTETAAPNLFGGSGTTSGLFGGAKPVPTSQPAGTSSNLFGSSGSSSHLLGSAAAPSVGLFSSGPAAATSGGGGFSSASETPAASAPPSSSLFGGGGLAAGGGLGSTQSSATVPATTGLFGSSNTPVPDSQVSASSAKALGATAGPGLFGSTTGGTSLFKPVGPLGEVSQLCLLCSSLATKDSTAATAAASSSPTEPAAAVDIHVKLENCQYDRIDDLLKSWELRLKRQVSTFGRFAEAVMSLDLDLCQSVEILEKLQRAQTDIGTRQQEIDLSLDQLEKQQFSLAEVLQRLQNLLEVSSPEAAGTTNVVTHPLQGKLLTISTNLDDSEAAIDELVTDVNKLQDVLHPGAFGEVVDLLNIQYRSVMRLSTEADSLRDRINQLDSRTR